MDGMVLASAFRNCGIQDAQFGEVFLAQDGEKFIIGRAGDGKSVAVMIDGDFGKHKPFYFAPLDTWNRRGVAVSAKLTLVPASQANPTAIPPGAVSVDGEMIHIFAFSGQSYQPVAIGGRRFAEQRGGGVHQMGLCGRGFQRESSGALRLWKRITELA